MDKLVGKEQTAFISGRSLHGNVMLTQNLIKSYSRKYLTPRCMLKVDISKAFDSIQWPFVQNMLSALNFPPPFIKWVMGCVTGAWGDVPSVQKAAEVVQLFSSWSGLRVNFDKSEAYFGGVEDGIKQQILCAIGLTGGTFPFRYLGLLIHPSRLTSSMFNSLIQKFRSFIAVPPTFSPMLFFWGYKEGRRMVFKGWKSICAPWLEGGFQVTDLSAWNQAYMLKL
ncbi:uncharacterized protein LOC141613940 [Silene latifolia]|uniref:uncharacterized protein LOC141613940 n=1 Tax=Silene latifolia TaxID=37657 RepID=UPI003D786170